MTYAPIARPIPSILGCKFLRAISYFKTIVIQIILRQFMAFVSSDPVYSWIRASPGISDLKRLIPRNYVTFNVKKSATWLWPTASGKYARNPCLPSLSRRETASTSVPGVWHAYTSRLSPATTSGTRLLFAIGERFFFSIARAYDSRISNAVWPRSSLNFDRAIATA